MEYRPCDFYPIRPGKRTYIDWLIVPKEQFEETILCSPIIKF